MRKAPYRPNNEVTQSFNDGIVKIYDVENIAPPGYKPIDGIALKYTLRYEEQRLGIQRYYSGRQNQVEIERVIRVPRTGGISNQDIAITEDGSQHKIDMVQAVADAYPPSVDITLAKIEQEYEVPDEVV